MRERPVFYFMYSKFLPVNKSSTNIPRICLEYTSKNYKPSVNTQPSQARVYIFDLGLVFLGKA